MHHCWFERIQQQWLVGMAKWRTRHCKSPTLLKMGGLYSNPHVGELSGGTSPCSHHLVSGRLASCLKNRDLLYVWVKCLSVRTLKVSRCPSPLDTHLGDDDLTTRENHLFQYSNYHAACCSTETGREGDSEPAQQVSHQDVYCEDNNIPLSHSTVTLPHSPVWEMLAARPHLYDAISL